jgi:hypothetical protein
MSTLTSGPGTTSEVERDRLLGTVRTALAWSHEADGLTLEAKHAIASHVVDFILRGPPPAFLHDVREQSIAECARICDMEAWSAETGDGFHQDDHRRGRASAARSNAKAIRTLSRAGGTAVTLAENPNR